MTVSDANVIDVASVSSDGEECILTIADHLPWGEAEHLLSIQAKINSYLKYLESGEILNDYPKASEMRCRISVACKYEPDDQGVDFLRIVGDIVRGAGYELDWKMLSN
jgi:hypothetical protein